MATTASPTTKVKLQITLNEDLYDEFAERATKRGIPVEREIVDRLTRCRSHTAATPLYFDDDQRGRLSTAINHTLSGPEDVIAKLNNLVRIKVSNVEINLPAKVQLRLATRVFRSQTLEGVIRKEVTEALERFTGIRPY